MNTSLVDGCGKMKSDEELTQLKKEAVDRDGFLHSTSYHNSLSCSRESLLLISSSVWFPSSCSDENPKERVSISLAIHFSIWHFVPDIFICSGSTI